jgi:hypothetical protein
MAVGANPRRRVSQCGERKKYYKRYKNVSHRRVSCRYTMSRNLSSFGWGALAYERHPLSVALISGSLRGMWSDPFRGTGQCQYSIGCRQRWHSENSRVNHRESQVNDVCRYRPSISLSSRSNNGEAVVHMISPGMWTITRNPSWIRHSPFDHPQLNDAQSIASIQRHTTVALVRFETAACSPPSIHQGKSNLARSCLVWRKVRCP